MRIGTTELLLLGVIFALCVSIGFLIGKNVNKRNSANTRDHRYGLPLSNGRDDITSGSGYRCRNCGMQLSNSNNEFCEYCGAKLRQ